MQKGRRPRADTVSRAVVLSAASSAGGGGSPGDARSQALPALPMRSPGRGQGTCRRDPNPAGGCDSRRSARARGQLARFPERAGGTCPRGTGRRVARSPRSGGAPGSPRSGAGLGHIVDFLGLWTDGRTDGLTAVLFPCPSAGRRARALAGGGGAPGDQGSADAQCRGHSPAWTATQDLATDSVRRGGRGRDARGTSESLRQSSVSSRNGRAAPSPQDLQ